MASLSTRELGEIVGCSGATISRYETGARQPDGATIARIARIADACSVTVAEIRAMEMDYSHAHHDGTWTDADCMDWETAVLMSDIAPYARLILAILARRIDRATGIAAISRDELVHSFGLPGDIVDEAMPAVIKSDHVERIWSVEWAFRLNLP